MSLSKKELTEKNQYEIEFTVDAAAFAAAVDRAYKKNVKKLYKKLWKNPIRMQRIMLRISMLRQKVLIIE